MYLAAIPGEPRQKPRYPRASRSGLQPRADPDQDATKNHTVTLAIIVVLVALVLATIFSYVILRRLRAKNKSPRFLPGFLKRRWQEWTPRSKYSQVQSPVRPRNLASTNTAYNGSATEERAATQAAAEGVNRNTSVRSVMTLPPYSQTPKESEQVIGREGERGGMDTVVEFPETQEEEEVQRNDEMEALYQIRLARRREIAEREERRRERRAARDRGDWARLEELRRESRARASTGDLSSTLNSNQSLSAATLLAEHQSRGRERRVSEVTYASVGHVRHDGTRLRANSNESESGGLLDGAAPMGGNDGHAGSISDSASFQSTLNRPHTRGRSGSSILSVSTNASDTELQARPSTTSQQESGGPLLSTDDSATSDSPTTRNRLTPDESTGSEDIGESRLPMISTSDDADSRPPEYEYLDLGEAPPYEASILARRAASNASVRAPGTLRNSYTNSPRLPQLNVPAIHVEGATEPNTPVTPSANGSTSSHQ